MGRWAKVDASNHHFECTGAPGALCVDASFRFRTKGEPIYFSTDNPFHPSCVACALKHFGERPPGEKAEQNAAPAASGHTFGPTNRCTKCGTAATAASAVDCESAMRRVAALDKDGDGPPGHTVRLSKSAKNITDALALLDQKRSHEETVARALFETDTRVVAIVDRVTDRIEHEKVFGATRRRALDLAWAKNEPVLRKECEVRAAQMMPMLRKP